MAQYVGVLETPVLWFRVTGLALGMLYSVPPVQLSARGLGEAAVAVAFGTLPVAGAAWLQSGAVDAGALLVSAPVGLWVAAILLINEVPDVDADRATGKRTLVVRLGLDGTRRLYLVVHALALLAVGTTVVGGLLPVLSVVLPVALMGLAVKASRGIRAAPAPAGTLQRAIESTLAIHSLGCLWLVGWVWYAA